MRLWKQSHEWNDSLSLVKRVGPIILMCDCIYLYERPTNPINKLLHARRSSRMNGMTDPTLFAEKVHV